MNGHDDILIVCLLIVNFFREVIFIFSNPVTQLKRNDWIEPTRPYSNPAQSLLKDLVDFEIIASCKQWRIRSAGRESLG